MSNTKPTRRATECPNPQCKNNLYLATYDYIDGVFSPVWECTNCLAITPRRKGTRPPNASRALRAAIAIRKEWDATNDALHALVDAGVASGCLLVHSSTFNYHLERLSGESKLSNWDVQYHIAQARKNLAEAKAFVAEKRAALEGQ